MKILITGGSSFIGSRIAELYQDRAEEIRVLDNLRTGYRHNLDGLRHTSIEGSITIHDLADGLIKAAGSASKVLHAAERAGDVRHSRASADKLRAAGWVPQYRLEDGLARTLDFFKTAK